MNKHKKSFLNLLLALCITSSAFCAAKTANVKAAGNVKSAGTDSRKVAIVPSSDVQGSAPRLKYPGGISSRNFSIINDNAHSISFSKFNFQAYDLTNLETNKVFSPDDQEYMDFFKNMRLSMEYDGKVVYEDTFSNVFSKGMPLDNPMKVDGKSKKDFKLILTMDPQSGNNVESLENSFDFGLTYVMDDGSVISSMPKTGSPFDSTSWLCIGGFSLGLGLLTLSVKSKDEGKTSSYEGGV